MQFNQRFTIVTVAYGFVIKIQTFEAGQKNCWERNFSNRVETTNLPHY